MNTDVPSAALIGINWPEIASITHFCWLLACRLPGLGCTASAAAAAGWGCPQELARPLVPGRCQAEQPHGRDRDGRPVSRLEGTVTLAVPGSRTARRLWPRCPASCLFSKDLWS